MKGIIVKVLKCTAVLAFCFGADGMYSETFTCEKGYRPVKLNISFKSARDATKAV